MKDSPSQAVMYLNKHIPAHNRELAHPLATPNPLKTCLTCLQMSHQVHQVIRRGKGSSNPDFSWLLCAYRLVGRSSVQSLSLGPSNSCRVLDPVEDVEIIVQPLHSLQ